MILPSAAVSCLILLKCIDVQHRAQKTTERQKKTNYENQRGHQCVRVTPHRPPLHTHTPTRTHALSHKSCSPRSDTRNQNYREKLFFFFPIKTHTRRQTWKHTLSLLQLRSMFLRSPQGGDKSKTAKVQMKKKKVYIYIKVRGGLTQNQNEKKKKVDHRREEEQRERTAISG